MELWWNDNETRKTEVSREKSFKIYNKFDME
jgi:hypothetical protein